ncbi:MFS transporter [Halocatena pleomorpha]|nr:MFS transporter [Halocatena pleomorpha]
MEYVSTVRHELSALWAGGKGKALAVIALGWGVLNGTRMIYPVLLPSLSTEFNLTHTTAGLLVTLIWVGYAIGQFPSGVLADRYGERQLLTASVTTVACALVVVVLAATPAALFAATGFVGLGLSLYPVARITLLSDLYPDRIGRVLGVTMATGDTGQTLLPLSAGVLVVIAWQVGLVFVVPLLVILAVALQVFLPVNTATDNTSDLSIRQLKRVMGELRQPTLVRMGVILLSYIGVLQTFSAFYPTYLINSKGFSPTVASGLFSLFFAVGIVAKPLAGVAYDTVGIRRSLPIVLSGAVIGFALLPLLDGFWLLTADTVLISTMLGSGAITQSYLSETIPSEIEGTGLGVIRSIASMLGATGPVLFGTIADRGFFDAGYLLLAVLVGAITLLALRLPKKSG